MERGNCYYRLSQKPNKWSVKYTNKVNSTQDSQSLDLVILY